MAPKIDKKTLPEVLFKETFLGTSPFSVDFCVLAGSRNGRFWGLGLPARFKFLSSFAASPNRIPNGPWEAPGVPQTLPGIPQGTPVTSQGPFWIDFQSFVQINLKF